MAHFAITDVTQKEHQEFERLTRGAAGLSGAQAVPYQVWLEDWSVTETAPKTYQLKASQGSLCIGFDARRSERACLARSGWVQPERSRSWERIVLLQPDPPAIERECGTKDDNFKVTGASWMDHEFSTSALSPDQVGWDWFSIQLDDNTELMFFQIRRADGSIDPFSSGKIVYADGSKHQLLKDDFVITVEDTWRSPFSGMRYPARWKVGLPRENMTLEIIPYLENQEMDVSYIYWEGAVQVKGALEFPGNLREWIRRVDWLCPIQFWKQIS